MAYRCSPIWACQHCPQYPQGSSHKGNPKQRNCHIGICNPLTNFPPPSLDLVGTSTPLGSFPPPSSIASVATLAPAHRSGHATMSGIASSSLFLPSMLGPLATPKPIGSTPKSMPLILSPALPPIPANLVTKILLGEFIDMKELLGDNIALHQRMQEVQQRCDNNSTQWVTTAPSPKLREISSPLSWVASFILYMAVKTPDSHTRQLLTYTRLILDMARRHSGKGWLEYDRTFRKQMACNPEHASWGELNPSLLAYAILGSETGIQGVRPGSWCSLCQEPDHKTTECALQSLEPVSTPPLIPPTPRSHTPGPIKSSTRGGGRWRHDPLSDICRKWNRGLPCASDPCKYKHLCRECQSEDHPAMSCPTRGGLPPDAKRP